MTRPILLLCTMAAFMFLISCGNRSVLAPSAADEAMPDTRRLIADPAPVPAPLLRSLRSMRVRSLIDGKIRTISIRRYGNGIRAHNADGCIWTRSYDWFAPSDSFANCGTSKNWHTATANVSRKRSMFPLRVGKSGRYTRRAVSHSGKKSRRRTRCRVTGTAAIVRPGRPDIATYVVRCSDKRVVRTTWYAPGIGPVAFRAVNEKDQTPREAWVRID